MRAELILQFIGHLAPFVLLLGAGLIAAGRSSACLSKIKKEIDQKVDRGVCNTEHQHITRELDQIHKTLLRIEVKVNSANKD